MGCFAAKLATSVSKIIRIGHKCQKVTERRRQRNVYLYGAVAYKGVRALVLCRFTHSTVVTNSGSTLTPLAAS